MYSEPENVFQTNGWKFENLLLKKQYFFAQNGGVRESENVKMNTCHVHIYYLQAETPDMNRDGAM